MNDIKEFRFCCSKEDANNARLLLLTAYNQLLEQSKKLDSPEFEQCIELAASARYIAEKIDNQL